MTDGDMLIAITEGGETSSVLGTVEEAADRDVPKYSCCFNNPVSVLVEHYRRSRRAIEEDPRVTVLELFCRYHGDNQFNKNAGNHVRALDCRGGPGDHIEPFD